MVSVLFLYRFGREMQLRQLRCGRTPDEFMYGLTHLDGGAFRADFTEDDPLVHTLARRLLRPLERHIARLVGIGFNLHLILESMTKLRRVDIVVSTVDSCGLPLAMAKSLGLLRTPIIYISQGLSHRVNRLPCLRRRFFQIAYGRFMRSVEQVLVLGDGAVEPVIDTFCLSPGRVASIHFGIDTRFWTPGSDSGLADYVLTVGSDEARDYRTLLCAVTDDHLRIVTRQRIPEESLKKRVEVGSEYTDTELRELYRRAKYVVVPLTDVDQPSGQSVALQAMACGKAVILTRTRGLWDPVGMVHLENCYLVEPGDVGAMRQAMRYLNDCPEESLRLGRNARRTVLERYDSRLFSLHLANHVNAVLTERAAAAADSIRASAGIRKTKR